MNDHLRRKTLLELRIFRLQVELRSVRRRTLAEAMSQFVHGATYHGTTVIHRLELLRDKPEPERIDENMLLRDPASHSHLATGVVMRPSDGHLFADGLPGPGPCHARSLSTDSQCRLRSDHDGPHIFQAEMSFDADRIASTIASAMKSTTQTVRPTGRCDDWSMGTQCSLRAGHPSHHDFESAGDAVLRPDEVPHHVKQTSAALRRLNERWNARDAAFNPTGSNGMPLDRARKVIGNLGGESDADIALANNRFLEAAEECRRSLLNRAASLPPELRSLSAEELAKVPTVTNEEIEAAFAKGRADREAFEGRDRGGVRTPDPDTTRWNAEQRAAAAEWYALDSGSREIVRLRAIYADHTTPPPPAVAVALRLLAAFSSPVPR